MTARIGAIGSFLVFAFCLLISAVLAPPAKAATFPCAIDSSDIAGLTFVNPLGTSTDGNSYALGGVLTTANVSATTGLCNSLPGPAIRPLVGATPTATIGLPVASATAQGGWLIRTASNEVRYLPPSHSFSGTDSFTIDNNNNTRVITVTVNVLPAQPGVTSISPTSGPTAGGTSVVISGVAYTGVTAVMFGATPAASYTVNSATQITATSPAGTGTVDVTVTTGAGTSTTSAADQFTYIPPPAVTAISPTSGPAAGGTSVVITGTNLSGATAVTFGGSAATGYTVNSATQITATSPAGTGTVDVRVTTAGGTSATSAADQFTYIPAPAVTAISPTAGPVGGGTTVVITGTNLSGATAVTFGATAATGFTVNSATQITATSPAGSAGTVDVRVVTPGGTSATSAADQFTYVAAPTVTSLSPTTGPTAGGITVVITGTGFGGVTAVNFGATPATGFTVNSATQITATSPAGTGTVDVRVTTVGGTSATSAADQFTYIPPPTVTNLSANEGSTLGGGSVTLIGTGFTGATNVAFGGTAASFVFVSDTNIVVPSLPARSAGLVNVTVTTPGGTSAAAAANEFTYIAPPTITSVSPTSGPTAGGTTVVITGTGFSGVTSVRFGATIASYTVNGATQITATSPAGTGVVDVRVTTVGGTSATSAADQFTFVAAPTAGNVSATVAHGSANNTITLALGGGAATSVAVGTQATNGTATAVGTTITYTPNAGYAGPDSFTYTATNVGGTSSAATVTITVSPPTITVAPPTLPAPVYATAYSQTITASGGTAPYNFAVTLGALPTGLTLAANGTLSGTPTVAGSFNFTVTATDQTTGPAAPFTGSQTYSFTIAAPMLTLNPGAGALPGATAGSSYSQTISANGGLAPFTYQVTAGALPSGVTLSPSTGILSGTPTVAGTFNFTVTATDANSFTVANSYSLTVAVPTLTINGTLPSGAVGQSYSQTLTASGGVGPHSFTLQSGTLPQGVTLSPTGVVSGTPTQGGGFNITIRATDSTTGSGPAIVDRSFTLVIGAPTITITPATLGTISFNTPFSASITASGGTGPYSFGISAGALPAGLTLANDGTLSGTPTVAGNYSFTVTAADSSTGTGAPYTGNQAYNVTIGAPTVTVSPTTLPDPVIGVAYGQSLSASGGTAPHSFAVTAGALPPGMVLSAGGAIAGTPTSAGTFSFTVTATDASVGPGAPYTGSRAYSLTVASPTITVTPATLMAPVYNAPYNATLSATGGTAGYSFAVTTGALPNGLTLATNGTLSGTPLAVGGFSFTVTATDSSMGTGPFTGAQVYSFTIAAPTLALVPPAGGLPGAAIGAAYTQGLSATGGTTPYAFAVTAGSLPAGLTLAADGTLSGTPTEGGSFGFTVTVTDSGVGGPFTASAAYTLAVAAPAVTIAPTSLPGGMMEAAYNQSLSATGGTAPYSYGVTAGALPAGLSLSAGGVLSGTPTVHGSFSFTVTATDSSTGTGPFVGTQAYVLTIAPPLAPIANPVSVNVGYGSIANVVTPGLAGGTATSIAVVTQPVHGTASVSGLTISYTPTPGYAGADSFTYSASNDGGTSAPATISATVANPVVSIGPASLVAGQQDVRYDAVLTAAGGAAPYSFVVTTGALPRGLTLATNGTLSGVPGESGSFTFTVTATDSSTGTGPFSAGASYTLQIALPAAPVVRDAPGTSVSGATVPNAASVDIDLSALTTGNYTDIRVGTQPQHGTVTLASSGQTAPRIVATYRPQAGYAGPDNFTFMAVGPGGTSSPANVAITVVGVVPVARSLSATFLNGREITLDITTGAAEGPFTNAAIVSITPSDSLAAELVAGGTPTNRTYGMKLSAIGRFSGSAVVRYTLSNVFGTSQPATVTVLVEARPDPSADPVVRGLSSAQAEATRRFASTQLDNFARRNEQLHGGGAGSRGQMAGIRLSGGDPDFRGEGGGVDRDDRNDPLKAVDMRALRGVQLADAGGGASPVLADMAAADTPEAPSGDRPVGSIELWTGGALQIGTRDPTTRRAKLRVTSSGLSAGLDLKFTEALTMGIGGGYGFDRTKIGENGEGRLDSDNWVGTIYGSWMPAKGMFVDGVFGIGGLDFETRRDAINGMTARGRRDGSMIFGSLATGFDQTTDRWRFSGYGRAEYMSAKLKAYAESGADIYNLAFAERRPESFATVLGIRGAYSVPSDIGLLTPRGRVEWRHEFNRAGAQALDYADIVGGSGLGYGYLIRDDGWVRDELQIEIGTGLEIGSGWIFGGDIGGRLGSGSVMGTVKMSATKRF